MFVGAGAGEERRVVLFMGGGDPKGLGIKHIRDKIEKGGRIMGGGWEDLSFGLGSGE